MFNYLSKIRISACCLLLFLFVSILLPAHASTERISENSLDKILQGSGLVAQIEQFPELIKAGMEDARGQEGALPEFAYNLILASIDQTILAADILSGIETSLRNNISQGDASQLIKWYESPLGKKVSRLEALAAKPETYDEMAATEEQLLANTKRLESAKRFDDLLNATAMNASIQKHTSIAIFSAVMAARNPNEEVNVAPLKEYLDSIEEQTRQVIKKDILLSFIYSYKDISFEELILYEDFLNTQGAKNFNKAVVKSMQHEIEIAISKWAMSLTSILRRKGATAI